MSRVRKVLTVAVVVTASACGGGQSSGANPAVARWILASDGSASVAQRRDDVIGDVGREIEASYTHQGGVGTYLSVINFAGGPGDVRSFDDVDLCREGTRQCSDPVALAQRSGPTLERASALFATSSTVGGSDPFGFMFQVLSQIRAGYEENTARFVVWSDLVSRIDTLLLDGSTDISSPEARSTVIEQLRSKGLDFGALDLAGVTIEVRHVPSDTAAISSAYAGHLRAFVAELLAPTGAAVSITSFTETVN